MLTSKASTPSEYIKSLDDDQRTPVTKLHRIIKKNLPKGFVDTMSYGMIGYVIPHKVYTAGYHCDPTEPLQFMSLAAQKNFVVLYHLGMYDEALLKWFRNEWKKGTDAKLDMGKGCIRLKKLDDIPYDVIGTLATKMTAAEWIAFYEKNMKR